MTDDGSRGHQLDLATTRSRPALLDSPVLLAFGYLGGALLCLFLVGQLLHAVFRFPYVILSGGTGAIYLMAVIVVFGTSLLVFGLSRHLALARRTIASRTAERDIAMAGIAIAADGILVADIAKPGAAIIYANPAFEEITGYPAAEAKGKNCRYLQGSDRLQPEIAEIRHAIERGEPVNVTLRNYRKDGGMFWNQLHLAPVRDELGVATHFVGVIRDVTAAREAASRLQYVTDIDRLTSIANRYRFHDRVEKLIKNSGAPCVLVIKADIARFHEINTSFGYQTGDALLIDIAARLSRQSDLLVGRLGTDAFGIAIELASPHEVEAIIARVHNTLAGRFVLPGAVLEVRFAIGFALGKAGDDALTLLRHAGVALHESKRTGLLAPTRYDSQFDIRLRNRVRLTSELQQASAEDNFVFHYQPKVAMETGRIIGAEALIRWVHPVFGLQPPDLFIPLAEESGLILDMGTWALRKALSFACQMNKDRASPLSLAVNVSLAQFFHRDILRLIKTLLEETGADPRWITLEMTESLFAESSPELISVFHRLRQVGIGLSIDDFGTGYSSLRYLDKFPVSEIKIDKSFVTNLQESRFKRVIVEGIVKIGRELNIAVTGEGVETAAEARILQDLGCPYGQGYFFSRPLPEEEFLDLLRTGGALVRTSHAPGSLFRRQPFAGHAALVLGANQGIDDPERQDRGR